ncbi:MAG: hypothetical protein FJX47_14305 [Alphaproteobacteria bacterium]|nr:hypothetical protein [Alphaproteobacteria bacterium]
MSEDRRAADFAAALGLYRPRKGSGRARRPRPGETPAPPFRLEPAATSPDKIETRPLVLPQFPGLAAVSVATVLAAHAVDLAQPINRVLASPFPLRDDAPPPKPADGLHLLCTAILRPPSRDGPARRERRRQRAPPRVRGPPKIGGSSRC